MRRSNRKLHLKNDSGVALVLALVFVVLLTVLIVEFSYEMQVDASLIERHTTSTAAYMAAKSSIALSMSILAADLLIGEDEAGAQGAANTYDSLDEPWASSTPITSMNDSVVTVQIDDEYGKLNLNALIYLDSSGGETEFTPLVDALTFLFVERQVEFVPVDVILDWLDSDDIARDQGAENRYYQSLETPFECKNGPMDSIEELLLLPGITMEMFSGDNESELLPLNELLTVHGHPEGKVNINTASADVIYALLSRDGHTTSPDIKIEEVLARIGEEDPYISEADLKSAGILPPEPEETRPPDPNDPNPPLLTSTPPPLFDVVSEVFRIQGDGQNGDAQVRIEAYVWRSTNDTDRTHMFRVIDWRVIQ